MIDLMTRRTLLATASAAAITQAKTLSTIGVQLYTVRSILPEKPMETLKSLEEIGYRECEVVGSGMDKIWDSLIQTKMRPVSLHLDTQLFMKNVAKLPAALDDAASKKFQYVVCPYIAPADRGGVDVMKKLADTLNSAGEKCKAAGLTLAYHNHAFEFAPVEGGSGTLLDVLMKATDPKLVHLEMDAMWVKVAGADPSAVLAQYKGRVPLMHLKNVKAGVESRFNEGIPKEAFAEVGQGVIDFQKVLQAAAEAGVKHYFVEQDQTPGNPVDSLRGSFEYLKKLNF